MKIVYFYPQFIPHAGTERILIDKMNYLAGLEGYEVVMLTFEQGTHPVAFSLSPKVRHIDLDVHYYPYYKQPRPVRFYRWWQLDKLLRQRYNALMEELRPDIVITTTYYATVMETVAQCPTPYAKVLESHIDRRFILSNDPANRKSLLRWLHMLRDMHRVVTSARNFDILVALKQADADDWAKFVKTTVISNIVHLNDTDTCSSQEEKRVIFVGRYAPQKGLPSLLQIWKQVQPLHPDWHLDLYGDGELYEWLCSEAASLRMNIHVNKPTTNIFNCYRSSSIFVLTSVYEPFGLVMPEAMSCGLPIVSFDSPSGPAEIITDGVDGFLIPQRDCTLFAQRLDMLMSQPDLRKQFSQNAIRSSQRFAPERIMPQWTHLFQQLTTHP